MPANRDTASRPVQVLRETTTALEAAVFECLQKPRKKSVHTVRTTTRRIEAQLNLLPLAGGFPPLGDQARKVLPILKKLRRAAGHVRDIDVQRDLIASEAEKSPDDHAVSRDAKKLRTCLGRCREKEADKLLKLLKKLHARLPRRIKALLDQLDPARDAVLPENRLLTLARDWYNLQIEPHWQPAASGDPDELHAIRKIAKLARYLAETAPESATRARRLAAHFEAVQKAGGEWHDWLLLAQLARKHLGGSSPLVTRFQSSAQLALADFRHALGYRM